ncbi:MAG: hypothetical protein AMJ77_05275 [Dehalococcoidia bacterium SM23_28_2]|nr:MAG: hypothetical protein AMJ77_05275 [Dehalococcoidia bacterium SM23_28_2]
MGRQQGIGLALHVALDPARVGGRRFRGLRAGGWLRAESVIPGVALGVGDGVAAATGVFRLLSSGTASAALSMKYCTRSSMALSEKSGYCSLR